MNLAVLEGNMVRNPVIRSTRTGKTVANFTIACNTAYTVQGQSKEITAYIGVVAWGHLAEEISGGIRKGDRVNVKGRIATRSWDDTGGQRHWVTEVVAESVTVPIIKTKNDIQSPGNQQNTSDPQDGRGDWGQFAGRPHATEKQMEQENLPFDQGEAPFPAGSRDEDIPF